jgi:hypothetical protein
VFALSRNLFVSLSFILLAFFGVSTSKAQDIDLSSNYQWKPVRIGAGPRGSLENRPMRITSKAANGREAGQGCYTAPEPSTAIQFRVRG